VHAVSHDLRSPLVSLLGFTRLFARGLRRTARRQGLHFLERVEQAGRTMESLIRDLLSCRASGARPMRRSASTALGAAPALRGSEAPARRTVELMLPEDPPALVRERTRLYQLFSNLIGNALDHMGDARRADRGRDLGGRITT
jgi:signal transduction histidine kinase